MQTLAGALLFSDHLSRLLRLFPQSSLLRLVMKMRIMLLMILNILFVQLSKSLAQVEADRPVESIKGLLSFSNPNPGSLCQNLTGHFHLCSDSTGIMGGQSKLGEKKPFEMSLEFVVI